MRRFSKLKKRIESLFAPNLDLQVHCTKYYWRGHDVFEDPRLWITLGKDIIFDFIKDFKDMTVTDPSYYKPERRFYCHEIHLITNIIHEYIEMPVSGLFDHVFPNDYFGLTDILKAADRRIGVKRLILLKDRTKNEAAKKIIDMRLSNKAKSKHQSKDLCSGVFWVISDTIDFDDYNLLTFEIPCDSYGNVLEMPEIALNAKSGNTYNHKKLWEETVQNNPSYKPYNKQPYNYYPRGRVYISNNCATIYLNPNINRPDIVTEIQHRFGLNPQNISKVRVVVDNSEHYRCYFDL